MEIQDANKQEYVGKNIILKNDLLLIPHFR